MYTLDTFFSPSKQGTLSAIVCCFSTEINTNLLSYHLTVDSVDGCLLCAIIEPARVDDGKSTAIVVKQRFSSKSDTKRSIIESINCRNKKSKKQTETTTNVCIALQLRILVFVMTVKKKMKNPSIAVDSTI